MAGNLVCSMGVAVMEVGVSRHVGDVLVLHGAMQKAGACGV